MKKILKQIKNKMFSKYYNASNKHEYSKWLNSRRSLKNSFNSNIPFTVFIMNKSLDSKYIKELDIYNNIEIIVFNSKEYSNDNIKNIECDRVISLSDIICHATNDNIIFLDGEGYIEKDTFSQLENFINNNSDFEMIYTDSDSNSNIPLFKPDYSKDTLLGFNYIDNLTVYKKDKLSMLDITFDLSDFNNYKLNLEYTDICNKIYHLPRVLYHSKGIKKNNSEIVEEYLKRQNIDIEVEKVNDKQIIKYKYVEEPLISIIIPTKDQYKLLDDCLNSIYENTNYKNYEVIVLNNNSVLDETFNIFEKYKKNYSNFRVIDANMPFNYSKINNLGVSNSNGEYIVLLNNDTKVISSNWLSDMVGYAMQKHIGAVGVKLLYKNNIMQHCGVAVGVCGVAAHIGIGMSDTNDIYQYQIPYDCSAVTAACMMVSKEKYNEVSGLDETLEVAYNDIDFCLKLLEKGYNNICLPHIKLYHYESISRGSDLSHEKKIRFEKECELMKERYSKYIKHDSYYNSNYSKDRVMLLDKKVKSND